MTTRYKPSGVDVLRDAAGLLRLVCIPQPSRGSGSWKIPPLWHLGGAAGGGGGGGGGGWWLVGKIKGRILVTATA